MNSKDNNLPDYIARYLAAKVTTAGTHIFRLAPLKLGASWVQSVEHIEQSTGHTEQIRLFGFAPIQGTLTVSESGERIWHELCDPDLNQNSAVA